MNVSRIEMTNFPVLSWMITIPVGQILEDLTPGRDVLSCFLKAGHYKWLNVKIKIDFEHHMAAVLI